LFRDELYIDNVQGQPKRYARAGGLKLHVRGERASMYIPCSMTTNNAGWNRGWFYLRNVGGRLPAFTNRVLRERPEKWGWGLSPQNKQTKLEPLLEALQRLVKKGLTVADVIANFHRQRVIPLMERGVLIFDLTLEVPYECSRTSSFSPATSLPGGRRTRWRSSPTTQRISGLSRCAPRRGMFLW